MENKIFKKGNLIMIPEFDGFDKEYGIVIQTDCNNLIKGEHRIKVRWVAGCGEWIYENTRTWTTIEIVA
jgi:hypothetical protein